MAAEGIAVRGFLLALLCLLPAAAWAGPPPLALPKAGSQSFAIQGVTLTADVPAAGQAGDYVFAVTSPGAAPATLSIAAIPQLSGAVPEVTPLEMDPINGTPEILVTNYTGGAHCCVDVHIFDLVGGAWTVVDGGSLDGGIATRDIDKDGETEIMHRDDRFLYVFSCYACAAPPMLYDKLVDGALADISASPLVRPLDEKQLPDFRDGCARHDNGACASYVALMTRLGRHDAGWAFMLKNYDPAQDWGLSDCAQQDADGKCTAQITYKDYPAALAAFLKRTGYMR